MEAINNTKTRYDKKHLAAVYILTSYSRIWNKVKYYVKPNRIDFKKMCNKVTNPYYYGIIKMAEDLYLGTQHMNLRDLTFRDLYKDDDIMLLYQAIMIGRNGYGYIGISPKFN